MAIYDPESNQHSDGRDSEASFYPKDKSAGLESEFVSYAEALEMKELGFDEPCFAYFSLSHVSENYTFHICGEYTHYRDHYINFIGNGLRNSDLKVYPTGRLKMCMTAPLWQQAFRWFREKHGLLHEISPNMACRISFLNKSIHIMNDVHGEIRAFNHKHLTDEDGEELFFKSYEEAQLACLRELIKIVKDGK